MRVVHTIRDTGVFFMGKDLQTLNGQNKLALCVNANMYLSHFSGK